MQIILNPSIQIRRGDVFVLNTEFNNTGVQIENEDGYPYSAYINRCTFVSELLGQTALDIDSYENFEVYYNSIDNFLNGIQVWLSGYGQQRLSKIQENTIINCAQHGIKAYNSQCNSIGYQSNGNSQLPGC